MFKKIMILFIGIVLILSILLILFMKQSKFGKLPEETRLEKLNNPQILKMEHFKIYTKHLI